VNLTGQKIYQKLTKRSSKNKAEEASPWFKYGTDADYQKWYRTQPCAVTGGTYSVIYAHYRTAANSGTGCKPPFSGIPLNSMAHLTQHTVGQYEYMTRERWEALVHEHLTRWAATKGNI